MLTSTPDTTVSPYVEITRRFDGAPVTTLTAQLVVATAAGLAALPALADFWPVLAGASALGALATRGLLARAPAGAHDRFVVFLRGACIGVAGIGALVAAMGVFFASLGSRWIL